MEDITTVITLVLLQISWESFSVLRTRAEMLLLELMPAKSDATAAPAASDPTVLVLVVAEPPQLRVVMQSKEMMACL